MLCRQMAPVRGKGQKTIDSKASLCAADGCGDSKVIWMNQIPFFCITQPIGKIKLGFKEGKIKEERGISREDH